MAGSSRALAQSIFVGLRVGFVTYIPAHSKNGKNISARARISAYMNIASKANDGEGRREPLQLIAWGKLADVCARACSPGKEINVICSPHVYDGRVFHNQQPVSMADGTVLTTKKMSFTIDRITFGEESASTIAREIQGGVRPQYWNVPGTQDYETWRATLNARNAVQFDPNRPEFGHAKVELPQGPGIGAYNPAMNQQAGVAPTQTLNGQVAQAVTNAAFAPANPQPAFAAPAQNTVAPTNVAVPAQNTVVADGMGRFPAGV